MTAQIIQFPAPQNTLRALGLQHCVTLPEGAVVLSMVSWLDGDLIVLTALGPYCVHADGSYTKIDS